MNLARIAFVVDFCNVYMKAFSVSVWIKILGNIMH
jgi:hypothetical protein